MFASSKEYFTEQLNQLLNRKFFFSNETVQILPGKRRIFSDQKDPKYIVRWVVLIYCFKFPRNSGRIAINAADSLLIFR